jgi:hypothetical protein
MALWSILPCVPPKHTEGSEAQLHWYGDLMGHTVKQSIAQVLRIWLKAKLYGGVAVQLHLSLTSALDGGEKVKQSLYGTKQTLRSPEGWDSQNF